MARKHYLKSIYQLIGFPKIHWDVLCYPILTGFTECELEKIKHIMLIRQNVLLPIGSIAEEIYRKRDIWTYALFIAACKKIRSQEGVILPSVGCRWLESDPACKQALELCETTPSAGILKEIIEKVIAINDNESSKKPGKKLSAKFVDWLSQQVTDNLIQVNTPGGLLHIVEIGVLVVSPKAFKAFDFDNWETVLKDVEVNHSEEVTYRVKENKGVFVSGYIISVTEFNCVNELLSCEINDSLEMSS